MIGSFLFLKRICKGTGDNTFLEFLNVPGLCHIVEERVHVANLFRVKIL